MAVITLTKTQDPPAVGLAAALHGFRIFVHNLNGKSRMYSHFYEPCLGKKDFPLSLSMAIDILYTRNLFRSQSNFFLDHNIPSPMRDWHFTLTPSRLWNPSNPGSERRFSLEKNPLRPYITGRVRFNPTFFFMCTYCSLLFIKCCQKKYISFPHQTASWLIRPD